MEVTPPSKKRRRNAPISDPTELVVVDEHQLLPGTPVGEYRIEDKIGEGGMGIVYAAVHPRLGARAAVKILQRELCADPFQIERFVDEARVVNQIRHPNIVDVFAFDELPDGRSYFIMEWLDGESLGARLARTGAMPLDEVAAIVRQLAGALGAAHAAGVVHRDLKPDNVFLAAVPGEPARVKLLDFGVAKLARDEHRTTKTGAGEMVGTPQYMAPEQAKGGEVDPRADVYALGNIVFEMLAGRTPFVADSPMEVVAKHLVEEPPRLAELVPGVPAELDATVTAMLAKSPDERPSLDALCDVLDHLDRRDRPVAPQIAGPTPQLTVRGVLPAAAATRAPTPPPVPAPEPADTDTIAEQPPARFPWRLVAAAVVVLALAAGLTYLVALWLWRKPAAVAPDAARTIAIDAALVDAAPEPDAVVPVVIDAAIVEVDAAAPDAPRARSHVAPHDAAPAVDADPFDRVRAH